MDKNQTDILLVFKSNIMSFVDELITQFPDDPELVMLKLFLENHVDMSILLKGFKKYFAIEQNRIMFENRNENFFLEHNPFYKLSSNQFTKIKTIWLSPKITADDKEVIWQWFELFKKISDKF